MVNATLTPPTNAGTQTGNFNLGVSFDTIIMGLEKAAFTLRALTENGITGIGFSIVGTEPTANFNLPFTVPIGVEGSLEVSITGMVTRQGSSTPEAVMSNTVVVYYDTTTNVSASFGTVDYRDGGVIAVPVNFGENVIASSKSVFRVEHVSGDTLEGMQYRLVGRNTDFELVFEMPLDRKGVFKIAAEGDVFKVSSSVWDNLVMTPSTLTVAYSTVAPEIVDWDIPAGYDYDLNSPVDIRIAYNVPVTGWHANNTITEDGIFILEGANLGTPLPYKWVGTSAPNFNTAVPADLSGTDWQLLATPPGGTPTPGMNGFNDDSTQWHGELGQYFLIRFPMPAETGIFNLTPRGGVVRGPVS